MFTLYRIAYANRKTILDLGLLFKHNNGDFGAILVTGQSCSAPISQVERHISDSHFLPRFVAVWTGTRTVGEVNRYERGMECTETEVNIQWRLGFSSPNHTGQALRYDVRCVWTTCSSSVPSVAVYTITFPVGTKSYSARCRQYRECKYTCMYTVLYRAVLPPSVLFIVKKLPICRLCKGLDICVMLFFVALTMPLNNFRLKFSYIFFSSHVKFGCRSWGEWPMLESFCEK